MSDANSEETTVIFEQLHSFVVDDDGFIEDKYIDSHELHEENWLLSKFDSLKNVMDSLTA